MKALRIECIFAFVMTIVQLPHGNAKSATMDGDINIAGLFEINNNEGGQCGTINIDSVMTFEATRWYIEQLNLRNALPFKLGFHGYKTCGLPDIAVDTVLNIIGCQWTRNTTQPEDFIVGLIGPATNEEAVSVATVLSSTTEENRFLQISPSATAATLGDRTLYPNFYRVIPGDATQITTILLLMKELSWNRIAILFEDNTYCRSNANSLQDQAADNHICVSKNLPISINEGGDVSLDQINTVLDQIMLHAPVVGGVILFAGKETANKVLFAMDKKGVDKVPLFILSETAGHTIDVFQSSGTVLTKTKGSMSVSSPYTVISSFSDYWLSLVTDMVLFKEKTVSNPWLNNMFESTMGCNPGETNSCQALSTEQARSQFPVQPLQVQYGILAAHTMAKASLHMYEDNCVGPFTVEHCLAELRGKFKPGLMIEQMKNISIDFGTDFHQTVVVEPLASSQFRMTFRDQAEPFLETDQEMYQVYNFQQISSNDNNDFDLVKVGSLLDNKLKLDIDAIRDYDSNGQESMFPDLRIGQCPVGQECTECIKPDIEDSYLHIPGDLYVIAIAPINDKALPGPIGCGTVRARNGFQVALALQFGVTWFNTHSDYLEYRNKFGGKKIGLIIINSCNNELTITRKILDLLRGAGPAKTVDLSNRILGFIGGLYTSVSLPLASILSKTCHVQVSYASTNPVLSDKTTYPYFLRIVTPDNVQAEAMMEVVKALRGEYIQIVYNEGAYGAGGRDSVIASAQARGICVAQIIEVQETEVYYIYYELIRRKPHAKIVIIFLNSHVVRDFMKDLNQFMTKGEFQFIGSEAWGKNVDLLQYDITKGALTVTLEMDPIRGLTSFVQKQLPKKNNADHPWLQQYVQKRHDCYFNWSYDKTFSEDCADDILSGAENNQFHTDSWCEFATTAVFSLLMGSAEFFSKSCGNTAKLCQDFVDNPDELVAEMHQISMDIYGTGEIQIFDTVGDGNMGYQIYNIKGDPANSDTLMYAKVGRFNLKTGLDINPSNVEYPTREELISSCPNVQACQNCFVTEPAPEPESSKGSNDVASIVLGVFVGILGIATIILVVIIILMKRNSTSDDIYLTPTADLVRPETLGKSINTNSTDELIEETQY